MTRMFDGAKVLGSMPLPTLMRRVRGPTAGVGSRQLLILTASQEVVRLPELSKLVL